MDRTKPVINTSLQRGALASSRRTALVVSLAHKPLKRPVHENAYSEAADSFCGCCFAGAGRTTAARSDAFLRRK